MRASERTTVHGSSGRGIPGKGGSGSGMAPLSVDGSFRGRRRATLPASGQVGRRRLEEGADPGDVLAHHGEHRLHRALAPGAALAVALDASPAVLVSIYDYANRVRDYGPRRIAC